MVNNSGRDFVGYEYKDVTVDRSMESQYIDGYQNFGWQLDTTTGGTSLFGKHLEKKIGVTTGVNTSTLKFKRDRKIINKAELTRLQRQFDSCANEIIALEKSKASGATVIALIIAIIGCAFLATSVFAITAVPPNIILCVILGVPGIIGWILPYFTYKAIIRKKTAKTEPLIDMKYEEMYEACEKGSDLLPK